MYRTIYSEELHHLYVAESLLNIVKVYSEKIDLDRAATMFEKYVSIEGNIHGNCSIHVDIVVSRTSSAKKYE